MFIRGQEICSGAQRCHESVSERMKKIHTRTHSHMWTHTHTHINTYILTHLHTCAHTNVQVLIQRQSFYSVFLAFYYFSSVFLSLLLLSLLHLFLSLPLPLILSNSVYVRKENSWKRYGIRRSQVLCWIFQARYLPTRRGGDRARESSISILRWVHYYFCFSSEVMFWHLPLMLMLLLLLWGSYLFGITVS